MTRVKEYFIDCGVIFVGLWVPIIAVLLMWLVAIPLVFLAIGIQRLADWMVFGAEWLANQLERLMEGSA